MAHDSPTIDDQHKHSHDKLDSDAEASKEENANTDESTGKQAF